MAEVVQQILEQKLALEKLGKKPRVIIINEQLFDTFLSEWVESYKELPWGDTVAYEVQHQIEKNRNVFLGDGTLFGLWIVKVNTIEGIEIR